MALSPPFSASSQVPDINEVLVATESFLHLNQLRRGQTAVVEEVDCQGPEGAHLAAMGLTVGCILKVLMPGAPCAVAVGETRLMLRCEQCRAIRVTAFS